MLDRRTVFEIHRLAREGSANLRIAEILELEREAHWKNSIERRFLLSRLTERVTIDQFDF